MTLSTELFEKVESLHFSARVNLASDTKAFIRLASTQPEFLQLREGMDDESSRRRVVDRALFLSRQPFDIKYENPYDAAVATYLFALSMSDEMLAHEVVKGIVSNNTGWWWAWKLSEYNEYITSVRAVPT